MTRIGISIGIISALVTACTASGIYLCRQCGKMITLIDSAYSAAVEGDTEKTSELAAEFSEEWHDFCELAHIAVRSDKLSEIESKAARVSPLAESDCDELTAELSELKRLVVQLRDGEMPTFGRIF